MPIDAHPEGPIWQCSSSGSSSSCVYAFQGAKTVASVAGEMLGLLHMLTCQDTVFGACCRDALLAAYVTAPCLNHAVVLLVLCGHRDIVRSVDCFSGPTAQRLLCLTSGEDAQLGLWTLDQAVAAAAASSSKDSADSAGPRRHAAAGAGAGAAVSSARRSPY